MRIVRLLVAFLWVCLAGAIPSCFAHTEPVITIGETFSYHITWLGISVGTLSVTVTGKELLNGRETYVVVMEGGTNRYASLIYHVRDRFVSYIDTHDLVPVKHIASRHEGRYRQEAVTVFDHERHQAYFYNAVDQSRKTYDIPPNVQDIISVFYRLRYYNIETPDVHHFDVTFAETVFAVFGTAMPQRLFRLPNGNRIGAYYTEPFAMVGTKRVTDGAVSAYFSDDAYRVPLRIDLKAPLFTTITAQLERGEPAYS